MPFLVVYNNTPVQTVIITKKGETAYKFALKFVGDQKANKWNLESYLKNDMFKVSDAIIVYRHRKTIRDDNGLYAPMVLTEDEAIEAGEGLGTTEYAANFLYSLANSNTREMATKLLSAVKSFKSSLVGKDHFGCIQVCREFIACRVRRKEHQKHVSEGTSCLSGCHICV
jgi:hypothetical protein